MDFLKKIFENRIAGSSGSGTGGSSGSGNTGGFLDHTVTFTVDGNDYTKISVIDGISVTEPTEPTVETGRLFKHWKDGDNIVSFPYTPQTDKILIANITEDLVSAIYEYYSVDRTSFPYVFIWRDAPNDTKLYFSWEYEVRDGGFFIWRDHYYKTLINDDLFVDDPSDVSEVVDYVLSNIDSLTYTRDGVGGVGNRDMDFVYSNLPASTFADINATVYQI